jgi:hypothetical protein
VSEKLALDQALGQRSTVYLHERPVLLHEP